MIIEPRLASGYLFWIVFGLLLTAGYVSLLVARILFDKWQRRNLAFRMSVGSTTGARPISLPFTNSVDMFSKLSPLLCKNLLKIMREKQSFSVVLTASYVFLVYMVSMNNVFLQDRISVLLALSYLYSFIYAYRSTNHFSPDEESPALIYAFPYRKSEFLLSVFTPAIAWLAIVITFLTCMILISGSGVVSAGRFWLQSFLVASTVLSIAANLALAFYPEIKEAQKRFVRWTIILVLLMAAFYRFHIVIAILLVSLSFYMLHRMKFYKTV